MVRERIKLLGIRKRNWPEMRKLKPKWFEEAE